MKTTRPPKNNKTIKLRFPDQQSTACRPGIFHCCLPSYRPPETCPNDPRLFICSHTNHPLVGFFQPGFYLFSSSIFISLTTFPSSSLSSFLCLFGLPASSGNAARRWGLIHDIRSTRCQISGTAGPTAPHSLHRWAPPLQGAL